MTESSNPRSCRALLTPEDLRHIHDLGKTESEVRKEIAMLVQGAPSIRLARPCRVGDGIVRLTHREQIELAGIYRARAPRGSITKFVVASGAASRMFRSQLSCLQRNLVDREALVADSLAGDESAGELLRFLDGLPRFAFFDLLRQRLRARGFAVEDLLGRGCYHEILDCLLTDDGLGYGSAPKGLIPFHAYEDGVRTAFEEHLVEASGYLRDVKNIVRIHFTVPPKEIGRIRSHLDDAALRLGGPKTRYVVQLSAQDRSTDTIVLDRKNQLVREENGRLLFRPSGHGALLENLNSIGEDVAFVRTIDNILPYRRHRQVCFFKQVLGGLLIALQEKVFRSLEALEAGPLDDKNLERIEEMAEADLHMRRLPALRRFPLAKRAGILFNKLNRPLRVCAMVPHESEIGGGPFWVRDSSGNQSLQIVEASQVDLGCDEQREIWKSSEYFNPADLVCGLRDFKGERFDLHRFRDPLTGFVTSKTFQDREIKVLERPGLWNGAMASWITVFVEVPKTTLHSVKNVLDLLAPEHETRESLRY